MTAKICPVEPVQSSATVSHFSFFSTYKRRWIIDCLSSIVLWKFWIARCYVELFVNWNCWIIRWIKSVRKKKVCFFSYHTAISFFYFFFFNLVLTYSDFNSRPDAVFTFCVTETCKKKRKKKENENAYYFLITAISRPVFTSESVHFSTIIK